MKIFAMLAITAITLTACTHNPINTSMNSNSSKIDLYQSMPITEQSLNGKWQLENSSLTLAFNNGNVSVLNGCNNIMANYEIVNHQLKVGSPISTRMACEKPLMEIDNLATNLLKGDIKLEKFVESLPDNAYLKISANGKVYKLSKLK